MTDDLNFLKDTCKTVREGGETPRGAPRCFAVFCLCLPRRIPGMTWNEGGWND